MRILIFLLLVTLPALGFDSFYYSLDQLQDGEANLQVIENELVKIIYPKDYKVTAERIANKITSLHNSYENDLKVAQTKITIVLRPYTAYSNAYVSLAPKMSEFVTVPYMHNELGHLDWIDLLTVHEYRHVIQQQKELDQGDQILYYVLGESGMGFHSVVKFPRWYYEGDAVYAETKYSDFARGDTSQFLREIKALTYKENLDYDIAYLGSLDKFYPDYYKMGYLIMTYLHLTYGSEAVEQMIQYANKRFLNFYAFENAIEVYTGKKLSEIFIQAQNYFRSIWNEQDKKMIFTNGVNVTNESESYQTYQSIAKSTNGIVAFKRSLNNISEFVLLENNVEKHLFYPTSFSDDSFYVDGNSIIYADIIPHIRYDLKSESVIKEYDISTRSHEILVESGFNYLPKKKNNSLLYVNFDGLNYRINEKNLKTKEIVELFKTPNRISSLDFYKDGIAFIEYEANASTFKYWNSGKVIVVNKIIGATSWGLLSRGEKLYFLSNKDGEANLFSTDLSSGIAKHYTSKFGLLSYTFDNDKFYVSDYTQNGAQVRSIAIDNVEQKIKTEVSGISPIEKIIKTTNEENFIERKLKTFESFWNLHSWTLLPDVIGNSYYFSAISRNVLNTFSAQVGLTYNFLESANGLYSTLSFSSPFAIWDLGFQSTKRNDYDSKTGDLLNSWDEQQVEFGPRINLNFSRGSMNLYLYFVFKFSILNAGESNSTSTSELNDSKLSSNSISINYTFIKRLASTDLQPRYGFDLFYNHTKGSSIAGLDSFGEQTSALGQIYLPSFNRTGIKLSGQYESYDLQGYDYGSYIPFARGYPALTSQKWNGGSFDFVFPIGFLELNIYDILYFKRIKGAIFYDYLASYNAIPIRSNGIELSILTHFLRNYDIALDIGMRYSNRIDFNDSNSQFFIDTAFSY